MIRPATAADAPAIAAIYNEYVLTTTISFEESAVADREMQSRIAGSSLPWLVCEQDGIVAGYAYASLWRVRTAYRHSVESSVYVAPACTGKGVGRRLYQQLIAALRERGMHTVIAGVAQPNPPSDALHQRMGFRKVASFAQVGWKHGRWIDVDYWQLLL